MQIGNDGSGASIGGTSAVLDNASLVFNHADAVSFAPVISGSGSLTQTGTGRLTLTSFNAYSGGTTITAVPSARAMQGASAAARSRLPEERLSTT